MSRKSFGYATSGRPRNYWGGRFNRINGVDWYSRLYGKEGLNGKRLPGLLDEVRNNDLAKSLIVSWELAEAENSPGRCFAIFPAFPDFLAFQETVPLADRCFYEVVLGQKEQKPHFDLDLSPEHLPPLCDLASLDGWFVETLPALGELLSRCLMLACQQVCREKGVELRAELDFLLFSTPGEKVSYHLVLPRLRHCNNKEAKAFYSRVMENPALGSFRRYPALGSVFDGAVYSKTQQFRLPGSHKRGRDSVKGLVNPFPWGLERGGERSREVYHCPLEAPRNERHVELMLFSAALLSFVSDSLTLPSFYSEAEKAAEERKELRKIQGEFPPLGDSDIDQALALAAARLEHFPFDLIEVRGNCLLLRRLAPSACPLCKGRVHQAENPYLMIGGRTVYWVCRRSVERGFAPRLALGALSGAGASPAPNFPQEVSEGLSQEGPPAEEGGGFFFQPPEGYEYDEDFSQDAEHGFCGDLSSAAKTITVSAEHVFCADSSSAAKTITVSAEREPGVITAAPRTQPVESVESVEQVKEVVQTQLAKPVESVEQVKEVVQTQLAKPVEQVKAVVRAKPVEQPKAIVRAQPAEQPKAIARAEPAEQSKAIARAEPVEQPKAIVRAQPATEQSKAIARAQPAEQVQAQKEKTPSPCRKRAPLFAPRPASAQDNWQKLEQMREKARVEKKEIDEVDDLYSIEKACWQYIAKEESGIKGVPLCEEPLPPGGERGNKKKGRKTTREAVDSLPAP